MKMNFKIIDIYYTHSYDRTIFCMPLSILFRVCKIKEGPNIIFIHDKLG